MKRAILRPPLCINKVAALNPPNQGQLYGEGLESRSSFPLADELPRVLLSYQRCE